MGLEQYEPLIQEAARQFQVDPELIRRMIQQESSGRSDALSNVGAQGLMQLMPDTAKDMGVKNVLDPKDNIIGGTKYIAQLLAKYGDTRKALGAYNAGPGNVDRYGGIPPFRETQDYVNRILKDYVPPAQEFPSDTSNPLGQQMAQRFPFKVKDPDTGRSYNMVMGNDSPPTEEEAREFIAQFEKENPAIPESEIKAPRGTALDIADRFKAATLEGGTAAQAVEDPGGMWQGLKTGIMASGGDPIKLISQMLVEEGKASIGRFTEENAVANEAQDSTTGMARRIGALAAGIPIFGELVKPMRESIPQDPNQEVDIPRIAGNVFGAGTDALLARFAPEAGIGMGGRGLTRVGSAMEGNATNRLARNAKLGPVTPREVASDIFSKKGMAVLATTALNPAVGALVAKVMGGAELAKLASRSDSLARMEGRLGRAMNPSAEDLMQGPMPDFPPNMIKTADELWAENPTEFPRGMQDDVGDLDFASLEEITRQADEAANPPNRVPTSEELWKDVPFDETHSLQDVNEPIRAELPEIKGREGKRIPFEDQNRVSRFGRRPELDEDIIDLGSIDDINLDEPEIISRRNRLIDRRVTTERRTIPIDPKAKIIPFADLEPGNRVRTANGKEGILESFDEKSVVVKWDNGARTRIARKAVQKVEAKKASPKGPTEEEIKASRIALLEGEVKLPHSSGQGFIKLYNDPSPPKNIPGMDETSNFLEVTDIWVAPQARKQGIATELYKQAVEKAKSQGKEGIISYDSHRNVHSERRWRHLLDEGLAEKLDDRGTYILRNTEKKVSLKGESAIDQAIREASESIDEPIEDIFDSGPKREASGTRQRIEPQYPLAQERLPTYKLSGEPTPRSDLSNPRMIGDSPRQLGLNDRTIQSSKVGWQIDDSIIKSHLSKGIDHVQVNIDEVFELAKKDIARPGRANQQVGNTNKLERAKNFLSGKSKTGVFTPELSIENGKLVISDGYHRMAAAKEFGEKSVPVRISLEDLPKIKVLGLRYRRLLD